MIGGEKKTRWVCLAELQGVFGLVEGFFLFRAGGVGHVGRDGAERAGAVVEVSELVSGELEGVGLLEHALRDPRSGSAGR